MNDNYMSLIGKLSQADGKSNKITVLIALGIGAVGIGYLLYQSNQLLRRENIRLREENDIYKGFNSTLISSNNSLKQENSKLKNTNDRQMSENQQLRAELASYRKTSGNDNVYLKGGLRSGMPVSVLERFFQFPNVLFRSGTFFTVLLLHKAVGLATVATIWRHF